MVANHFNFMKTVHKQQATLPRRRTICEKLVFLLQIKETAALAKLIYSSFRLFKDKTILTENACIVINVSKRILEGYPKHTVSPFVCRGENKSQCMILLYIFIILGCVILFYRAMKG